MCGRITLTRRDLDGIARDLGASFDPDDATRYKPRYNAAPSELLWLLVASDDGERRIVPAVWGLPSQRAERPQAVSETASAAQLPDPLASV